MGYSGLTREEVLEEQINLVGSKKILDRIEANFKTDQRLDTYFMAEQMALYAWRKKFFARWLPAGTWVTDCNFYCVAEGVCGEAHREAAVHYNITENFDYLLDLVVTEATLVATDLPTEHFTPYFHTKYGLSDLLAREGEASLVRRLAMLDFSQAVHALCALHAASPPTLRELAIRKVVEEGLPTVGLPRTVVEQVERGLYHRVVLMGGRLVEREAGDGMEEREKPRHLTKEGAAMLERYANT